MNPPPTLPSGPDECPYPGLRAFITGEERWFFGREAHVDDLLTRLENQRFLAIVGSSGSGKSSLVFAGLIPALREGELIGGRRSEEGKPAVWHVITFHPGTAPLAALASAIVSVAPPDTHPDLAGRICAALEAEDGLSTALEMAGCVDEDTEILVYADQFEELFRFDERASREDRERAHQFARRILEAATQRRIRVHLVLSMRSEAIGSCELFPMLPDLVSRSQFLTPRLDRSELRYALRCPAEAQGWQIEDSALTALLNDCATVADDLPLAQHILRQMWFRAVKDRRRILTHEDYRELGGIKRALSLHGARLLASLAGPEGTPPARAAGLEAARKVFMALCDQRADGPLIRRHSSHLEIEQIAGEDALHTAAVLQVFGGDDPGFIREEKNGDLDIRHEAIFRQWTSIEKWENDELDRLKIPEVVRPHSIETWREREVESETWLRELAEAAKDLAKGRTREWVGPDLEDALRWLETEQPNEAWAARHGQRWEPCGDFLKKCIAARDRDAFLETARKEKEAGRQRIVRGLTMLVAVLLVCIAVTSFLLSRKARKETEKAETQKLAANNAKIAAEDAQRMVTEVFSILETDTKKALVDNLKALRNAVETATRAEQLLSDTAGKADAETKPGAATESEAAELDRAIRTAAEQLDAFQNLSKEKTIVHKGLNAALLAGLSNQFKEAEPDVQEAERQLERVKNADSLKRYVGGRIKARVQRIVEAIAGANRAIDLALETKSPKSALDAVGAVAAAEIANAELQATKNIPLIAYVSSAVSAFPAVNGAATEMEKIRTRIAALESSPPTTQVVEWSLDRALNPPLRHQGPVRWIEFFPQASQVILLASASDDRFVSGWNDQGVRVFHEQASSKDGVNAIAISPDGKFGAAASNGSTVRIYRIGARPSDPMATAFEGHSDSITSVDFDPKSTLVASSSADQTVRLFKAADNRPVQSSGRIADIVTFVRFSPDGAYLVSSCDDAIIRLHLLVVPGSKIGTINRLGDELAGPVRRADFSTDGKWVVASAVKTAYVRAMPTEAWQTDQPFQTESHQFAHPEAVLYSTLRPASPGAVDQILTCCANGQIRLYKFSDTTPSPKDREPLGLVHRGRALFADWSRDGRWFATCGDDGAFILWDCGGARPVPKLRGTGHTKAATQVRISPDAKWVATAGDDNQAILWNVEELTAPPPPEPPKGKAWLEFGTTQTDRGPDGKWQKREDGNWTKLNNRFPEFLAAAKAAGIPGTENMKLGRWVIHLLDPQGKLLKSPQHTMILEPGYERERDPDLLKLKGLADELKLGTTPSPEGVNPKWKFIERLE